MYFTEYRHVATTTNRRHNAQKCDHSRAITSEYDTFTITTHRSVLGSPF